ncbi:hypothetical protein NDU88_005518, partial [Pleurodeles waltl]
SSHCSHKTVYHCLLGRSCLCPSCPSVLIIITLDVWPFLSFLVPPVLTDLWCPSTLSFFPPALGFLAILDPCHPLLGFIATTVIGPGLLDSSSTCSGPPQPAHFDPGPPGIHCPVPLVFQILVDLLTSDHPHSGPATCNDCSALIGYPN